MSRIVAAIVVALFLAGTVWVGYNARTTHADGDIATAAGKSAPAVKRPGEQTIVDKAMLARKAIQRDDFATADGIIEDMVKASAIGPFRYYPFEPFIAALVPKRDAGFLAALDKWVAAEPNSGLPYLVRAAYYHEYAWQIRGHGFNNTVSAEDGRVFQQDVAKWMADSLQAARFRPEIPYSLLLLMKGTTDIGTPEVKERTYRDAITKFPGYYPLYDERLAQLSPKWGGSWPEMYNYLAATAGKAPAGSPLKMLQLGFLNEVVGTIEQSCPFGTSFLAQACLHKAMAGLDSGKLDSGLEEALGVYNSVDKFEFNEYLLRAAHPLVQSYGYRDFVAYLLKTGEKVLGRDNYALNSLTAYDTYLNDRSYNDAVAHDRRALQAMEAFAFPSEEARNARMAASLDDLSSAYQKLGDYRRALQYSDRAIAADDGQAMILQNRCVVDDQEKDFKKAVEDCGRSIDLQDDNPFAEFFRAEAYEGLGEHRKAVSDYIEVMHFKNVYGGVVDAAYQNMAAIYFNHKRYQEMIDLYDLTPRLFDPSNLNTASVTYNNRCYAYMETKQYEKALDDCNKSLALKYSDMAEDKRRQLEKLVNAPAGPK